ncbi:hypothetical protein [Polyangium sp. y55x31]|uniref:hypothetical protein n=1 Tax=Polyangium sp. y55x31 TaxID=3042688 RepID=UPI002482BE0E|nr:hypothetical protein [Polyangium sp. y55x31]MDI1482642.1 hypothetical protein [Polyangium sp. y55x31]
MAYAPSLRVPEHTTLDAPFDLVPEIARFEPPDIVVFSLGHRDLTDAEAAQIVAFTRDAAARTGGLFSVTDATVHLTRVNVGAALAFNRQFTPSIIRAAAVIGASYRMRTVSETLIRAARLLKLEIAKSPIRYFDDHASARAWFAELRTNPA